MLRTTIVISFFLSVSALSAQTTVRLELKQLPPNHPANAAVYIAGSFNGWNPADEKYRFRQAADGSYFIELKLDNGSYEYKITRGSWDKVESQKNGSGIPNRSLKIAADTKLELTIEEWQDRFATRPRISSANKHVHIIDTAFWMPQLKRKRRVWIYLPEEYDYLKSKFGVLYMHDGQNVFDDLTSFSGEWGVDEMMDSIYARHCIVVAVDHGGDKRLNEYNPYNNERYGKGEGDAYVDFIVKTLKPYIDKHYRVKKDKENTYIAGSSMGGLISMYAILKYPKVFGGAGVFSPAFWVAGDKIYDDIRKKGKKVKANIYFYAGKQEGESMVPGMLRAVKLMSALSKSKIEAVIRDEGKHNESTWRKEFPGGYLFMLYPVIVAGPQPGGFSDQH